VTRERERGAAAQRWVMGTSKDRDAAFRQIYTRYYLRVVRFFVAAFRLPHDEAEELAQETFVRFFTHMKDYRGDAEWAFLETVARNVWFNRIRANNTKKRQGVVVELDDPDAADVRDTIASDHDPHHELAADQVARLRKQELTAAINALPTGTREVLQLYLEDFSYTEIAEALRISVDAVKSRIRDAKKLLRSRLGSDEDSDSL